VPSQFDDLVAANRRYAETFDMQGLEGRARAGVAIVTCIDSRIDPLRMVGLRLGDAKVLRNPGGRITDEALGALILGSHLLGVNRVLIVPHTRCAVAMWTEGELQAEVGKSAGRNASWQTFGAVDDQVGALIRDLERVRTHELIPDTLVVSGFVYDVDTGLLTFVG
jgi:carbonic anhydrase